MPSISSFLGITIYMYWREHNPPHFRAEYGEYEALVNINELDIFEGELPRRALGHVLEWASTHQRELLDNWERCRNRQAPNPILPLE
jgi:hypothetical protein